MDVDEATRHLQSNDPSRRAEAAEAICLAGSEAAIACLPLLEALGDEDEAVREWVNAALEAIPVPHSNDVPLIAERVVSSSDDVAVWAATLLGRAGPAGATAVPRLLESLESNDVAAETKSVVIRSLGKIGYVDDEVLRALRTLGDSPDPRLARTAVKVCETLSDMTFNG